MEIEELLKPRYKVIAADTSGKWTVGDIYTFVKAKTYDHWINQDGKSLSFNDFDKYPHLFKPLLWHEDRNIEDMPEYLTKYIQSKNNVIVLSKEIFVKTIGDALDEGVKHEKLKKYINKSPIDKEQYIDNLIKVKP